MENYQLNKYYILIKIEYSNKKNMKLLDAFYDSL